MDRAAKRGQLSAGVNNAPLASLQAPKYANAPRTFQAECREFETRLPLHSLLYLRGIAQRRCVLPDYTPRVRSRIFAALLITLGAALFGYVMERLPLPMSPAAEGRPRALTDPLPDREILSRVAAATSPGAPFPRSVPAPLMAGPSGRCASCPGWHPSRLQPTGVFILPTAADPA